MLFSKHHSLIHFYLYCCKAAIIDEVGCLIREGLNEKKRFLSGIARMMGGGGLPMPEFFGPLFRSAFLVNKKSLFLQKMPMYWTFNCFCTTVGAKVLKCLSLCPATIGRMKNNWGKGDKPLCISYLSFHAREAAHPFAFYHCRPNSLTLIVFDLTLWHHGEASHAMGKKWYAQVLIAFDPTPWHHGEAGHP